MRRLAKRPRGIAAAHASPADTAVVDAVLPAVPGLDPGSFDAFLAPILDREDPARDGWGTEVAAAAAKRRLGALAKHIERGSPLDADALSTWATADYESAAFRPEELEDDRRPSGDRRSAPQEGGEFEGT